MQPFVPPNHTRVNVDGSTTNFKRSYQLYGGMPSRCTPGDPLEVALIFSSRVYRATSDRALSIGAFKASTLARLCIPVE
jgi:hypothetical protein